MFQAFNILRYEVGQKYNSHYDAFDEAEYGPLQSQRVRLNSKVKLVHSYFQVVMDFVDSYSRTSTDNNGP